MLDTKEATYTGTCGEKILTLTGSIDPTGMMPTSHITVTNYPIDDDWYVRWDYDPVGADSSYAGADAATGQSYTVDYSIAFTKYDPGTSRLTGSFTFTVKGGECSADPDFSEDLSFSPTAYTFDL